MFRTIYRDILDRLERLDARVARIEQSLEALRTERELREELELKRRELDALGQQGLHIVEQLDAARRRVRELEAGRDRT